MRQIFIAGEKIARRNENAISDHGVRENHKIVGTRKRLLSLVGKPMADREQGTAECRRDSSAERDAYYRRRY